jgi:glycosyltransferase involved in cell wall biosynthesis
MLGASGIGRYLSQLVPRLIGRRELAFSLMGRPTEIAHQGLAEAPGAEVIEADAPIYSLREQWVLWRSVPRATELFWSPHYNIPLAFRGRLLVTVHDVLHLARPEYVQGLHRRAYAKAMFAALARRASRIVCDSHFTADELARHAGVDPSSIVVVALGVDAGWFEQRAADAPPHPRPYFLCLGNVKPHKNLGAAVDAFARLADELPHDLVVVGRKDGFITGDRRVVERAARLGERVRFTGEVPDDRLGSYLRHAEALLFPSLYEGFGLPPLEAMASGCPVLASSAASLPEVCGDAALYFDPHRVDEIVTQIRRLVSSPALAQELRERGWAQARRFTWERCADETESVLREVLDG